MPRAVEDGVLKAPEGHVPKTEALGRSVLTAKITYMRLQIDRFEGGGRVVVLPYPGGRGSFDAPREFFPEGASAGDVFDVRKERDPEEAGRLAGGDGRLLDGLTGGGR